MTMNGSRNQESKKSSVSFTYFNSKITKKKRILVKKRPTSTSTSRIVNNDEPKNTIIPVTSSRSEAEATIGTQSSVVVSDSAKDRALKLQANLSRRFPSLVKTMKKSHVLQGFWLGLDKKFCNSYLPNSTAKVILVDENEEEFETIYLEHSKTPKSFGLSGGWIGFAKRKKLRLDDVLIFQLVEPCKLKVYIVRSGTETGTDIYDAAESLVLLNSHVEPMDTDQDEASEYIREIESQKYDETLPQDKYKHTLTVIDNYNPAMDEFDVDSDNGNNTSYDAEVLKGVEFSQHEVNFRDVKRFDNFTIQVDGLNLDSSIPMHAREKYYKLCSSQGAFLHENLIKGLNCNLVTEMIFETINIADAIKEMKPESVGNLKSWNKLLESFEGLGMRVGFLRARITKLLGIYQKYQAEIELKQSERDEAEGQVRCLEEKLCSIRAKVKRLDSEICDLIADNSEFIEIAGAAW